MFRIVGVGVALGGVLIYEKFFERPRIKTEVAPPRYAAGWTPIHPTAAYSLAVPPGFTILDPKRADYQAALQKAKKEDPEAAERMQSYAKNPPANGFQALRVTEGKSGLPHICLISVSVEHAEQMIRNDDDALQEMTKTISQASPDMSFQPVQKLSMPTGEAYLWTGRGQTSVGIPAAQADLMFIDKWDGYDIEMLEIPESGKLGEFARQVGETFRKEKTK